MPELIPKIHELVTKTHVLAKPISTDILDAQADPSSSKL
jgi:hypothetical protein